MSRKTDHKPKSVKDDWRRLELIFARALEDGGELWSVEDRKWILKQLDPVVTKYRTRAIELGVGTEGKTVLNGNGGTVAKGRSVQPRRSA